jgi:hypothetical protein
MNKLVFASVISEIKQSDIFMTVKARICEAPAANLNGARVTEDFISEIVDNKERYVGLPLYADVRALINGNYRRLGHLYDSRTGEFHSTQIGSFYDFEKEELDEGCALVGYARIAKRNKKLSKAISELFTDGALKFSFEVAVGEYEELDDGTILIDVSDSNYLEGTAIVTFPACEEAVALELVAQHKAEQCVEADDIEGGEKEMADNKVFATEEVAEQPVVAEETNSEAEENSEVTAETTVEANTEENAACKEKEKGEEETAETAEVNTKAETEVAAGTENAEQQNAAVVVHEYDEQSHSVYAYDTESGVDVSQRISIETHTSHVEPDAQIVEADDGLHIAEADGEGADSGNASPETVANGEGSGDSGSDQPAEEATDEETVVTDATESKKTAEQLIAELAKVVENLKNEIAELKETKAIAEAKTVTAEINPMMDDIRSEGKYSLLEKEEKLSSYSLLSK